MARTSLILHLQLVLFVCSMIVDAEAAAVSYGLKDDYYHNTCPSVESVVSRVVRENVSDPSSPFNLRFAAGLLRLAFHDCFVEMSVSKRGCDASLLLNGPGTGKTAPVSEFVTGFEILDYAKEELEKTCPGVVSCADILQHATRDSVVAVRSSPSSFS
ncbi:hypothetical protein Mapa_015020 [Marchantia paleacea]|nr:hypothetical protein Mapa_015020 [Marchantia paleacea]